MKTATGKTVKITNAGYLYIDGIKITERKINPLYTASELIDDDEIINYVRKWIDKNWKMVNA